MARPTNKNQLIEIANTNIEKLWQTIDSLTEEEFTAEFDFSSNDKLKETHWLRDKNVRDVLVHLYEWHQLLLDWVKNNNNHSDKIVGFLPQPYSWKTYPEMNVKLWEKHQGTSYDESVSLLKNSHLEVMKMIGKFTDEELFTKKYFPWTGSTNLAAYCISATSSHYDWSIKKIKQHRKCLKS